MKKRLETLEDFKNLKEGDKVTLVNKEGKLLKGSIDRELTNRGYIDLNEIEVYIESIDYPVTVNVDKYLKGTSKSLKDFILHCE